jgi:hypothetical protein
MHKRELPYIDNTTTPLARTLAHYFVPGFCFWSPVAWLQSCRRVEIENFVNRGRGGGDATVVWLKCDRDVVEVQEEEQKRGRDG